MLISRSVYYCDPARASPLRALDQSLGERRRGSVVVVSALWRRHTHKYYATTTSLNVEAVEVKYTSLARSLTHTHTHTEVYRISTLSAERRAVTTTMTTTATTAIVN